jgi:hypothetical protein
VTLIIAASLDGGGSSTLAITNVRLEDVVYDDPEPEPDDACYGVLTDHFYDRMDGPADS